MKGFTLTAIHLPLSIYKDSQTAKWLMVGKDQIDTSITVFSAENPLFIIHIWKYYDSESQMSDHPNFKNISLERHKRLETPFKWHLSV